MSRNQREGRYVGHAWGQHVRRHVLFRRVRSTKARAVLRRRRAEDMRRFAEALHLDAQRLSDWRLP